MCRMIDRRRFYYVFIVVVIRYETTSAAGWTLMFIVSVFINFSITVAIWTDFSFHLCLMWVLTIYDRMLVPARPAFALNRQDRPAGKPVRSGAPAGIAAAPTAREASVGQ
jgi:hypothetical protein